MERRNNPAGEPCRDWKDTLAYMLMLLAIGLVGVVIGIGLCKLCPEFWYFVNWGLGQ